MCLLLTQPSSPDRVSYIPPCCVFETLRQRAKRFHNLLQLGQFTKYCIVWQFIKLSFYKVYRFLVLHNVPVLHLQYFKITKVSKLSKKYVSNVHYTSAAQTQVWRISHHDDLCSDHLQRLQYLLLANRTRIRECMIVFNQKQGISDCRSWMKSSFLSETNWDACIGNIQ